MVRVLRPACVGCIFAMALIVPTRVDAQAPQPAAPLAAGAVDVANSRAFIFVGKVGLGHEHAIEGRLASGAIHLGATQNAGTLVFDMRSFQADTDVARKYIGLEGTTPLQTQRDVTANMLSPAVLDANRFPQATYRIDSARALDAADAAQKPKFLLEGQFTLHNVTRPLKIEVVATHYPHGTKLQGSFMIRQTDFGITPYSKAFGAIGVADPLKIWGDLWLPRSQPAAP